jgi:aldehyde:ferredoxin oxidoreductase
MSYLYAGNILLIDLSNGNIGQEPTSTYSGKFLGGRGINIKLLYDRKAPGRDPLDPESPLIIGVGPLGGTSVSSGRTELTAKSPESGLLGLSNFGGYFGGELKFAGYDHIVITGKADRPVYVWIDDDQVEIRDATQIWGKDAYKTQTLIRREINNPEAKVLCIGPAGENRVKFASVQSELGNGAGRTGMGAVMGSKNLKAIAVRGKKGLKLADPKQFLTIAEKLKQTLQTNHGCQEMAQFGVSRIQDHMVEYTWDPAKGEMPRQHAIFEKYNPKRAGCFGCPVQCMDNYQVEGVGSGVISCEFYVEYTSIVGCSDPAVSLECALMSQKYGIDCVSSGRIIRWLMQLHAEGIITADDTDGIPMEWGSPDAIRGILKKMTYREGIGDVLADGLLAAADHIGRGSEAFVNHVKGIPMGEGWEPTTLPAFKGIALANAIGSRGDTMTSRTGAMELEIELLPKFLDPDSAAHAAASFEKRAEKITGTSKAARRQAYEGKPALVVYYENIATLCDAISTCKYLSPWNGLPFNPKWQAALLSAGLGVEFKEEELVATANKIRTLERAYQVHEGLTRDQDGLPKRFTDRPVSEGKFKGEVLESEKLEDMKNQYYDLRGWDMTTGIPGRQTLERMELGDVADDLAKKEEVNAGTGFDD